MPLSADRRKVQHRYARRAYYLMLPGNRNLYVFAPLLILYMKKEMFQIR